MRFILAVEGHGIPLVLTRTESSERGAELFDLTPVVRPVAGPLRSDRPIVMRLRFPQKLADCA